MAEASVFWSHCRCQPDRHPMETTDSSRYRKVCMVCDPLRMRAKLNNEKGNSNMPVVPASQDILAVQYSFESARLRFDREA